MLRKKYTTYIAFICALTFGCQPNRSAEKPIEGLSFETISSDTSVYLFNDSTYPKCRIEISMEYVAEAPNAELKNSIDRLILQSTLGEKYEAMDIENAIEAYIKDYIEEYKSVEEDITDGDQTLLLSASYNFDNITESKLSYKDQNILCLSNYSYLYTGGAHGMNAQLNYVYDLRDGKVIALNDIFDESSYADLGTLIVSQITADKGYSRSSELYDEGFFSIDEIYPTENFGVDTKGITWVYNPYEIAAYAVGQTSVFIPWEQVAEYTKTDSPIAYLIEKD